MREVYTTGAGDVGAFDDAYYGRIEKGVVAEPSFATICAIADALKIPLESFR